MRKALKQVAKDVAIFQLISLPFFAAAVVISGLLPDALLPATLVFAILGFGSGFLCVTAKRLLIVERLGSVLLGEVGNEALSTFREAKDSALETAGDVSNVRRRYPRLLVAAAT